VLKQDISWYDTNTTNDFASRMTDDLNKLQEGIGEKLAMLCFFAGSFTCAIVVAFIYGWELTLVLLAMIPLMTITNGALAWATTTLASKASVVGLKLPVPYLF
jgi:ATP-binding cassette, subfamily B (MDR/TAP), member 1